MVYGLWSMVRGLESLAMKLGASGIETARPVSDHAGSRDGCWSTKVVELFFRNRRKAVFFCVLLGSPPP